MFKSVPLLLLIFFIVSNLSTNLSGQEVAQTKSGFFVPSDTFNQKRFNYALGISAATYTGFSIGLYHAWYKQYPQGPFRFFNDGGEWNNMDKYGHIYTAYFQGVLCYKGAKWTGLSDGKSILVGAICGGLFQTTIEVMDGFSSQWGFSLYDMGANALGIGAFALQQSYWKEQKIRFKVSSQPSSYPNYTVTGSKGTIVTLQERADHLFGSTFLERYLKDYNGQVYWISFGMNALLPKGNKWPHWLNIALGYGADNMFGGFENSWESNGEYFEIPQNDYPRIHQFYLAFDLNLSGVKSKSSFLKGVLSMFDTFRIPSPALELNSRGEFTFHILR